ncbi:histidinol-phosphate transaminase [soil metagenome]
MTDVAAPAASQVYTWEPSNRAIAERYGLRPGEILRFDTNTSPASPEWAAATLGGDFEPPLNEYPDSSYADLTAAAAAYLGISTDRIVVGAGADEIIDLVAKAWLGEGATALLPTPTYGMYGVVSNQRGARVARIARLGPDGGYGLDLGALLPLLAGASVVWLCDPNNPTGAREDPDRLLVLLDVASAVPDPPLVVIDEAYAEFVEDSAVSWLDRYPHLLVVRTLSKAFALAGARVGYAAGSRSVIARLGRVRPQGSISTMSATLGAEALSRPEVARANATRLASEREWLAERLTAAGWPPAPSVTNFLLVPLGDRSRAEAAADHLLRVGIVPRTFPADHPLADHLRLTVRSRAEDERLMAVIDGWRP